MIHIGEIRIQDTGYIIPTNEGTQATSGNRANSGTVIALKTAEFIPALTRNSQDNPDLGTNVPARVNKGSLENMKFQLRCILNTRKDADMDLLQHLLNCIATDGYLVMWYDYTNASNERNNGQMIYQMALNSLFGHVFTAGEMSAFSISTAFYHLHIHINNAQFQHTGNKGNIAYTFTGVVVKVEASII